MNTIIGYCGIVCSDCPAYIATQANDQVMLEQTVARWREEFNNPAMTVADIICDGCLSENRRCAHCAECEIRACGVERGVTNCAYCADYSCRKLDQFLGFVPDARKTLDQIRLML